MAKAKAIQTCPNCGTEFCVERIFQNRTDANNWETYMLSGPGWLCSACYAAEQAAKKAVEEAAYAVDHPLPDLSALTEGSEKQIQWALRIREKLLRGMQKDGLSLDNILSVDPAQFDDKVKDLQQMVQTLLTTSSAKWIIDHREDMRLSNPILWMEE